MNDTTLAIVIISFLCCMITLNCISLICTEINDDSSVPHITFDQFKAMYAIAPEKWRWRDYTDQYIEYSMNLKEFDSVKFPEWTRIMFKTRKDYREFSKFKDDIEQKKINIVRLRAEAALANSFQQDINEYREKVIKELKAAVDM